MPISTYVLTPTTYLPASVIDEIATDGAFDEIPNHPDNVRSYIYNSRYRDKETNKLWRGLLFVVYQRGRYGPQNGFRLVFVHDGYFIAGKSREHRGGDDGEEGGDGDREKEEDEIALVERDIPQGHVEVVILGKAGPRIEDPVEDLLDAALGD